MDDHLGCVTLVSHHPYHPTVDRWIPNSVWNHSWRLVDNRIPRGPNIPTNSWGGWVVYLYLMVSCRTSSKVEKWCLLVKCLTKAWHLFQRNSNYYIRSSFYFSNSLINLSWRVHYKFNFTIHLLRLSNLLLFILYILFMHNIWIALWKKTNKTTSTST